MWRSGALQVTVPADDAQATPHAADQVLGTGAADRGAAWRQRTRPGADSALRIDRQGDRASHRELDKAVLQAILANIRVVEGAASRLRSWGRPEEQAFEFENMAIELDGLLIVTRPCLRSCYRACGSTSGFTTLIGAPAA